MISTEDPNFWITVCGILIGILVTVIAGNHYRAKNEQDTKKIMKETEDKVTQNIVDVANAQERVRKIGGKVAYRDNKEVGADLKSNTNETVPMGETISYVLKPEKQVVSRHEKKFSVDAILTKEDKQQEKQEGKENNKSSDSTERS